MEQLKFTFAIIFILLYIRCIYTYFILIIYSHYYIFYILIITFIFYLLLFVIIFHSISKFKAMELIVYLYTISLTLLGVCREQKLYL